MTHGFLLFLSGALFGASFGLRRASLVTLFLVTSGVLALLGSGLVT